MEPPLPPPPPAMAGPIGNKPCLSLFGNAYKHSVLAIQCDRMACAQKQAELTAG